jgi:hypothetical protein
MSRPVCRSLTIQGSLTVVLWLWLPSTSLSCRRRRHGACLLQLGQDFLVVKPAEAFLLRADLMHVDVIVPGLNKLSDLLQMLCWVRATDNPPGHIVFAYQFCRRRKMRRGRQFLGQFAFETSVGPVLMRRAPSPGLVLTSSARWAYRTKSFGGCSSLERA